MNNGSIKEVSTGLKQKAYEFIREKIIACEFMPEQDISEDYLVQEMGISRTPVREALLRLENEKLVSIYPRKGIIVSSISINTINSVFQVREIIEPQVLRRVAGRLTLEWLQEMKERFSVEQQIDETLKYQINSDRNFHSHLIRASNNTYLIQLMDNIFAQDERIRVLAWKNSNRLDTTKAEHLGIINAIIEGDMELAEKQLLNHILSAKNAAMNLDLHFG